MQDLATATAAVQLKILFFSRKSLYNINIYTLRNVSFIIIIINLKENN